MKRILSSRCRAHTATMTRIVTSYIQYITFPYTCVCVLVGGPFIHTRTPQRIPTIVTTTTRIVKIFPLRSTAVYYNIIFSCTTLLLELTRVGGNRTRARAVHCIDLHSEFVHDLCNIFKWSLQ